MKTEPIVAHSESPRAPHRILTLDGLRGAAVLLVLAHHYVMLSPLLEAPLATPLSYLRAALYTPTATGVDLFFVLSGFLVSGILIDYKTSPRLLPTFYLRRFLRIVPLAWLCITTVFLVGLVSGLPRLQGPIPWWPYYTFTVNFFQAAHGQWWPSWLTPLWSVAIEEQFYLLFPLLVRLWPERRLAWLGPALIAVAAISRAVLLLASPDNAFACHVLMPCRLDAFGCGVIAAWMVRSKYWPAWRRLGVIRWLLLIPSGLGIAALTLIHNNTLALASWGYTAFAVFYATVLLLVYEPEGNWIHRLFSSPVLRVYGKYSYFIYLFQSMLVGPVLGTLFHGSWYARAPTTITQGVIAFVLPLPLAWISWRCLEQPLLAVGRRASYA